MADTRIDALPSIIGESRALDAVVAALRQLAVSALDAGEPLAAARIAATADRIEAEAVPELPPPGHRRRHRPSAPHPA